MGDGAPAGGAISNMTPRGELEEDWKLKRVLEEGKGAGGVNLFA